MTVKILKNGPIQTKVLTKANTGAKYVFQRINGKLVSISQKGL